PISVWPEETFARIRCLSGSLHPIETVYLRLSLGSQCLDRYAFRVGQNLPDKKFRYLRIVIVTTVVHQDFGHRLPCHQVTNFLDLPVLGRRKPPYMVLRLPRDLCFW
ncbi:hypothetical protein ES332_D10G194600v1, partial [Gossypium tomentosum]